MYAIAKLFANGRSQAVRLPAAFRFPGREVFVRRDPDTGDVILSRRPGNWDDFFALVDSLDIPVDVFQREQSPIQERPPL